MVKKRLIFSLLFDRGIIQLSRNFSLQAVGSIDWLVNHFDFEALSHSVDELVILDVTRGEKAESEFAQCVLSLSARCFMPMTAGGGVKSVDDAYRLLNAGADKVAINTVMYTDPDIVVEMARTFGRQCLVASIDYRRTRPGGEVFISNGSVSTGKTVEEAIHHAEQLGAGEIYLTSMERDGTGQGYDIEMLESVVRYCQLPVIASGGVGDFEHFVDGMRIQNVTGASTANIFNFVGEGFREARTHIGDSGIRLAEWSYQILATHPKV